ncbi:MAG: hypothetical protein NC390_00480 [Fusobacterium sp.]|nr:hypothetical protein [Fusobacterium sp.]
MSILKPHEESFFDYLIRVFYIHTKDSDKSFNEELNKTYDELGRESFKNVIIALDSSGFMLNSISVKFPVHERFETCTDGLLSEDGIKYAEKELSLK